MYGYEMEPIMPTKTGGKSFNWSLWTMWTWNREKYTDRKKNECTNGKSLKWMVWVKNHRNVIKKLNEREKDL